MINPNETNAASDLTLVVPESVQEPGLVSRLGDDFKTLGGEMWAEPGRGEKIGSFALGVATQVADRSRLMAFVLPTAFDKVLTYGTEHNLNSYETAGLAAGAVGGVAATWLWGVGRAFHRSIESFPETSQTVAENHPVMVEVVSKGVSGFVMPEESAAKQPLQQEGYDVGPYDSQDSVVGKVGLAVSRGLKGAFLYGTTAYVGMANLNGYSKESTVKVRRAVTLESGLALGTIAAGLSVLVSHDALGMAEDIKNVITNKKVLLSASGSLIGVSAISNWFSRRGAKKQLAKDLAIEVTAVEAVDATPPARRNYSC